MEFMSMNEIPKGQNIAKEGKGIIWSLEELSSSSLAWNYFENSDKIIGASLFLPPPLLIYMSPLLFFVLFYQRCTVITILILEFP